MQFIIEKNIFEKIKKYKIRQNYQNGKKIIERIKIYS